MIVEKKVQNIAHALIACATVVCGASANKYENALVSLEQNNIIRSDTIMIQCDRLDSKSLLYNINYFLYIKEDSEAACKCIKVGLQKNMPDIYAIWGQMIISKSACVDSLDEVAGVFYLKKSIDEGSVLGMRFMSRYYIKHGDINYGLKLLQLASSRYDDMALYEYGAILLDGNFSVYGIPDIKTGKLVDMREGTRLTKIAADKGNPYAMLRVSDILYKKNRKKSFCYILRAYEKFKEQNEVSYLLDIEEKLDNEYREYSNRK